MGIVTDQRGVVLDWLAKMLLVLAVLSVVVFDAGSIITNYVTLDSTANDIAIAVSPSMSTGEAMTQTEMNARAKQMAREAGAKLLRVRVDQQGVVHIRIRRVAKTLLVGKISATKHWARAIANGRSGGKA